MGILGVLLGLSLLMGFAFHGWSILFRAVCQSTHSERYRDIIIVGIIGSIITLSVVIFRGSRFGSL